MPQIHFAFQPSRSAFVRPLQRLAILTDVLKTKCDTQSFPVVCDSPSPGTSWRNRENPAPLRAHALPRLNINRGTLSESGGFAVLGFDLAISERDLLATPLFLFQGSVEEFMH